MQKYIPLETYSRRSQFEYFSSLQNPHVGVTADVDVTDLLAFCRERGYSFYLTFMHAAALAANGVPAFRQRIDGDGIVEYDFCNTSHTESAGDGNFCFCTLRHNLPFAEYIQQAEAAQKRCRETNEFAEDPDAASLLFISSSPWFKYTALIQPTNGAKDSNPRITWGKYEPDWRGRQMMPVSLLCHHALVDGAHFALFYAHLGEEMKRIVTGG